MSGQWRARAIIDTAALHNNVRVARKFAGQTRIYAVVKADAYGHGIENVIPALSDRVDGFAVATLNEAIRCRSHAPRSPIIVLSEFNSSHQLRLFEQHELQVVIHRPEQVNWMEQFPGTALSCWLKIDTGMNRLGVLPGEAESIARRLNRAAGVKRLGSMSHLASADDLESGQTSDQIETFIQTTRQVSGMRSMANSAGLINWSDTHFDLVRPGLLLFGGSPVAQRTAEQIGLQPVMRLEARLIAVRKVALGQDVGYGATWTANRPTRLGIISFGYADGYPRCVSNIGHVVVNGKIAPLTGQVSMDLMTVDLSECSDAREGDTAFLWGPQLPVEMVAQWANTIPYELLCGVSPRVPRVLTNN